MAEFRVVSNTASSRTRDRRIRRISWGTVLALSGITLFAVYAAHSASRQVNAALLWLAVLIVAGAIVGARFLAIQLGLERVERNLVFVLTDTDLVRKGSGWPDVRIAFSEISALFEQDGWLVVESVEPRRKIAVPAEVQGFALLRAELAKHGSIVVQPHRSLVEFIPMAASLLCWGVVLWSNDPGVLRLAAAIALISMTWESFRLYTRLRQSPKRLIVWIWVGLGWLAAILIVYLRVVRAP